MDRGASRVRAAYIDDPPADQPGAVTGLLVLLAEAAEH
jgi:hypothetical protein